MEINLSSDIEQHEEMVVWSSEGHGKSYTCTFCKRGFSNAQALGGHMNIHRKDRARLKEEESSSTTPETLVPLDITKKMDGSSSDHHKEESSDEKVISSTLKRPWVLVEEDAAGSSTPRRKDGTAGERTQLPLFVEAPSTGNDLEASSFVVDGDGQNPLRAELDLELRLGPEPQ